MQVSLYKYEHEQFQTLFLCEEIYTLICKNDCVTIQECWDKTCMLLNKTEFYTFLHMKEEKTLYLFNDFISVLEEDVIYNFCDNCIAGIISDTYGDMLLIPGKDIEYDKHIYSVTYFWMLIMSKAMRKFSNSSQYYTDDVEDMINLFFFFGMLRNQTEEYPSKITTLIKKEKLIVSYRQPPNNIEKNLNFYTKYIKS